MGIFTSIFRILCSIFSCFPFWWCINNLNSKMHWEIKFHCSIFNLFGTNAMSFSFTIIIQKSVSGLKNNCNVFCVLMQYTLSSAVNVLWWQKKKLKYKLKQTKFWIEMNFLSKILNCLVNLLCKFYYCFA